MRFVDVALVEMTDAHQEMVREWRSSPEVSKYMYTTPEISPEQQRQWFARVQADATKQYWMIQLDGRLVGVANVVDIDAVNRRAAWAFYLGDPETRGRGVGGKVEFLVLRHVFETLQLNKLCCEVFCFNAPVIKMHQRFGFEIEGTRRQHYIKQDQPNDVVEMALFREDWQRTRADLEQMAQGVRRR